MLRSAARCSDKEVLRPSKVCWMASATAAKSKVTVCRIIHRSWKSFMRLLATPSEAIVSVFSGTTVSAGKGRRVARQVEKGRGGLDPECAGRNHVI